MAARPIQHLDAEKKDDDSLRAEARAHLAESPSLQLVAELLAKLRAVDLPFWSPEVLRERWSAAERMRWYRQRPDLRQKITTGLTGLAPRAARKKMPDFQAALIDSVVDEGDVTARAFEASFDPVDLAVYGSAAGFWFAMRELFPWTNDAPAHQEIVAWLLKALLSDASSIAGLGRVPILTPWDLRTAIDGRVWHTKIPLEIRVAIDDARMSQERDRPGVPFHAQDDLAIAVPDILAASIPLRDLAGVLTAAERAMGFDKESPRPRGGPPELKPPTESTQRKSMAPPPADAEPARASIPPQAALPSIAATPASPSQSSSSHSSSPSQPSSSSQSSSSPSQSSSSPSQPSSSPSQPSSSPSHSSPSHSSPAASQPSAQATATPAAAAPATPAPIATPAVAIPSEVRRHTPGVPTLEDELERTNPWVVPSAEELAAAAESPSSDPESSMSGRRRRRG